MKFKLIPFTLLATFLSIGLGKSVRAEACNAYTVETGGEAYSYREVNNCPLLSGTFYNSDLKVTVSQYEPATYMFEAKMHRNKESLKLFDFNVQGATNRPQYKFRRGNKIYVVTFRPSNPNVIRLELYRADSPDNKVYNKLLYR